MSEKITTMQLGEGLEKDNTDWERLREMKDEDIDCSDIPALDGDFWKNAVIVDPDTTEKVTLRVKQSVLDYFKEDGKKGYQTRINKVLESYVKSQHDPHQHP
ncbi:MAG: BrnA antitoxin family protein [Rhodothermales bacterium]